MSNNSNTSRLGRAIIGLLLVMWGLGAMGIDVPFGLFMLAAGLLFLGALARSGQWSSSQSRSTRRRSMSNVDFSLSGAEDKTRRGGTTRTRRQASSSQAAARRRSVHRVAAKAVRKAGLNPREMPVAPVDIGVLVYDDAQGTPTLYRETRLPEEAEYLRPFVLLRSPRRAKGTIRFELVDGDGSMRFVDETPWELRAGETFVYPHTWLPMHKIDDLSGEWQLRVSAAGMLLAVHEFMWWDEGGGDFRAYLTGDGEISDDLIDELSGLQGERLSLDALLDDQEGGVIEYDPEAEEAAQRLKRINDQYNRRR